ncbi:MAG: hypothetical protein HC869_25505, partial [Rhodospirillales bacterium]|nr:hypothetical protein [Rhodospirillales bacterium]
FTISYGMVLNLLSTRSLAACRDFLDRSFLRFQATKSVTKSENHARVLEERAAMMMPEGDINADEHLNDAKVRWACNTCSTCPELLLHQAVLAHARRVVLWHEHRRGGHAECVEVGLLLVLMARRLN